MNVTADANDDDVRKRGRVQWSATKIILLSVTFLLASSLCALVVSSSSSSSTGNSWWDGMKFDDADPNHTLNEQQHKEILHIGRSMIQIPCGLIIMVTMDDIDNATTTTVPAEEVLPLSTIIDTSLTVSTIQSNMLQHYPQLQPLVRRVDDDAGDETSPHLYLPWGTLQLRMGSTEATVVAPALKIVHFHSSTNDQHHDDSWELRLGLDFLRRYQARLDLGEGTESLQLRILSIEEQNSNVVTVPLIRPRPTFHVGDQQDEGEL
jgi:hypothetical protein